MFANALAGGVMIGFSALLLYGLMGRIAGISGISFGLLWGEAVEQRWRLAFILGLGLGGVIAVSIGAPMPVATEVQATKDVVQLMLAGLLVGFGTQLGNGCTSGHGVCGLARLSPRSLVSVITFMAVGMLVARKLCSSSTWSISPTGNSVAGNSADRTGLPSLPKVTK